MKLRKFFIILTLFALSACSNNVESSTSGTQSSSSEQENSKNIIHGRGVPNNNDGQLYSLYVDDDTNKIYEKNIYYVPQSNTSNSIKRSNDSDNGKWIYTKSLADENFDKESSVSSAIRNTFLSTNITLKITAGIDANGEHHDGVTYYAYNFGSVLLKCEDAKHPGFDDAILAGYSTYDIESDKYQLFLNNGGVITDCTSYFTSDVATERSIASIYVTRCLNGQSEDSSFSMVNTILKELDNFETTDRIYKFNQTINIDSSSYYDEMPGEDNYYIELKNLEFKLNEDGNALDYFKYDFGYFDKGNSLTIEQTLLVEVSNFRTTYFEIPE